MKKPTIVYFILLISLIGLPGCIFREGLLFEKDLILTLKEFEIKSTSMTPDGDLYLSGYIVNCQDKPCPINLRQSLKINITFTTTATPKNITLYFLQNRRVVDEWKCNFLTAERTFYSIGNISDCLKNSGKNFGSGIITVAIAPINNIGIQGKRTTLRNVQMQWVEKPN